MKFLATVSTIGILAASFSSCATKEELAEFQAPYDHLAAYFDARDLERMNIAKQKKEKEEKVKVSRDTSTTVE